MTEITLGFVIVQIVIALVGYVIRQTTGVNIGYIFLAAFVASLIIPLFSLGSEQIIAYYINLLPSYAIGAVIGNAANFVTHTIRRAW